MKVIGRVKRWKRNVTCRTCKNILEIVTNDIRYGNFHHQGDNDWQYYVTCIVCSNEITIEPGEIPNQTRDKARKRNRRK